MAAEYPKDVKLKDGSTVTLKPFERKDKEALFTFFQRLPEGDRIFLKDNVADPAVIERWRRSSTTTGSSRSSPGRGPTSWPTPRCTRTSAGG